MTDTETLDELRDLHRRGTPESTVGLATLFEVMARRAWVEKHQFRPNRSGEWHYDRHRHPECACTCPILSVGTCGGPHCEVAILSVHAKPPAYCSKRCMGRASKLRCDRLDIALVGLLQENRAGLDEDELATLLGVDTSKIRDAEARLNRDGERVTRTQRTDLRKFDGYRWHLALTG